MGRKARSVILDLGREAEQAHDLGHPRAGDPFPTGDGRLAGGLPGFEEGLPLDSLRRSVTTQGVLRVLGGLGLPRRGGMALTTSALSTWGR